MAKHSTLHLSHGLGNGFGLNLGLFIATFIAIKLPLLPFRFVHSLGDPSHSFQYVATYINKSIQSIDIDTRKIISIKFTSLNLNI